MATYSKLKLSGSTDGRGIAVAATASTGTTIHTAVTGTSSYDEVWIYAVNTDSTARKLTIEFGGTTTADLVELTIQPEAGPILVIPGWVLHNAKVVTAFAASASVINLNGFVNRIV